MKIIEIDSGQRETWDKEISRFERGHPFNSYGWGKVREVDGWAPSYFMACRDNHVDGMVMVLSKALPGTGFSIMYAPKGPICNFSDQEALHALLEKIKELGKKRRAIFLRIDPNIQENEFSAKNDPFVKEGFIHLEHRWSFWNSPRDVYRVDLTKAPNEEELFNTIDRDARRCVRKSRKEGVIVRPADSLDELRKYYEIFREFTVGKGFMCRKFEYQEALWNEFVPNGNGQLFLAIYQGEIIGGLICLLFEKKCVAMHMGVPYKYHKLQPFYALIWESIRWAKERECIWYSFRGVGTTPSQESFKRKFRPDVVALAGYYDLPLSPMLYRAFYIGEFEVLPRVFHTLMKIRKAYNWLSEKTKRMKVSSKPG